MTPNQTPRAWLMTDERLGDALPGVIAALPEGIGVVFRHHSLDEDDREALGRAVAELGERHRLVLSVSRDVGLARRLGAAMVHNPPPGECGLPFSLSVHDERQAVEARRRRATLAFVSPVFPSSSHPRGTALGQERAIELAGLCGCPAIALGGMNEERFARLAAHGFTGWAGIDAWLSR